MNQNLVEELKTILQEDQIRFKEPMKNHITFRVGGPAEVFLMPKADQMPEILKICHRNDVPAAIIGNGSNLLVGDKGIPGVVINIGNNMNHITVEDTKIRLEAGATLAAAAMQAAKAGLTGLEFAAGIPGTFGGAVVMNAGAYGGEMKDVIESVKVLDKQGNIKVRSKEELDLSYRHSCIPENGEIVLEGVLNLKKGVPEEIRARMEELRSRRMEKQPLEYPSAGSTFKRPEGHFAGKLIMDAGLKGYSVGGAQVSEKHCGFVINKGDATAADICKLMDEVIKTVEEKYAVTLEPEVKKLGVF